MLYTPHYYGLLLFFRQQGELFEEKLQQLEEKHKIQMQVQKSHLEYEIGKSNILALHYLYVRTYVEALKEEIDYQSKLMDESRVQLVCDFVVNHWVLGRYEQSY